MHSSIDRERVFFICYYSVFTLLSAVMIWLTSSDLMGRIVWTAWLLYSIYQLRRYINGSYWRTPKDSRNSSTGRGTEGTSQGTGSGNTYSRKASARKSPRVGWLENRFSFNYSGIKRVPKAKDPMPILAKRGAYLCYDFDTGKASFQSCNKSDEFSVDADAECLMFRHKAPRTQCSCGFYAVPSDELCYPTIGGVRLLVELSGVVIEHEEGYRAQHQRILECQIPRRKGDFEIHKLERSYNKADYVLLARFNHGHGNTVAVPLCECHRRDIMDAYRKYTHRVISVAQLEEKLGVKVVIT